MTATNDTFEPLKLSEFCDRIQVDEREVRYALARGIIPKGIRKAPGRGRHRQFDARQSFWMSLVLRLKAAGIKTPLAGEIAKWSERVKGYAVNLGWDWKFSPFDGQLRTEKKWVLEVGDAKYVRILTDACPTRTTTESLEATDWVRMTTKKIEASANPIVVVQVNLSELARLLLGERSV